MATATPDSARRRGGRLCEDCGEAEAALDCECCGQELCRGCWAGGDEAFCGPCRRGDWDDALAEEVPAGLLLDDARGAWR